ncbi:ABC transporter substrate-binding protein [Pradoshia sp.]
MRKLRIHICTLLSILCVITAVFPDRGLAEKKENQSDELVLALTREPRLGFDPMAGLEAAGTGFVHSTLLSLNNKMEISYDLAEEYQVSEDKLLWEFKLRDDAYFTDGRKVTAYDVAFTYHMAKERGEMDSLAGFRQARVIDDYTVQFLFERPLSSFVYTAASIGIVSSESYGEDFESEPVGSGPYQLVKWEKGKQAVFVRNDRYYGHQPFFRRIHVFLVSEDEAYAMAKEGRADLVQSTGAYAADRIAGMETLMVDGADNRGLSLVTVPAGTYLNGAPAGNAVTMDPAIRKAIQVGVDRERIVEKVLNGFGKASLSAAFGLPWGPSAKSEVNTDKAEELLRIGGWVDSDGDGIIEKKGIKAAFTIACPFDEPIYKAIGLALQEQLVNLGIKVIIQDSAGTEMKEMMQTGAAFIRSESHNPFEAYNLYHSNNRGLGLKNPGLYASAEVDAAIETAFSSGDFADWKKAEELALEDVPIVWLVNIPQVYFVKDGLSLGKNQASSAYPLSILNGAEDWRYE